jgi:hypothetical protein
MDAVARKFHETQDMKVKDEIERLLKEYGKLKEPWGVCGEGKVLQSVGEVQAPNIDNRTIAVVI